MALNIDVEFFVASKFKTFFYWRISSAMAVRQEEPPIGIVQITFIKINTSADKSIYLNNREDKYALGNSCFFICVGDY